MPGKKKENGGGESEGSKYYVFWADHKAALKFIFSHLIEAPEDLGGIERVLWKYAARKTRKDTNSNWKWQKKIIQKKKKAYISVVRV